MRLRLALALLTVMTIITSCAQAKAPALLPGGAGAAADSVALPVPERFQLSNGLQVWYLESRAVPLTSLGLVLRGGSALDPPGKAGLAALAADMLDEGAGSRGPLEIAEEVDFLGADLSVEAQKEYTEVSLDVLTRNLEPALDLLADIVLRPSFSPKEWTRVKDLAVNDLAQRREEPQAVVRVCAERVFYGEAHPFSHPTDGYESTVKGIDLAEARDFYRRIARPARAVIVAVGSLSRDALRASLEKRFGGWKGEGDSPASPALPPPASAGPRLILIDKPGAPQTEIRALLPAPSFGSPALAPLSLANTVLGGTFTSRLMTNLREKHGYTYGASSVLVPRGGPSYWSAGAAVHSDKTVLSLIELRREMEAMSAAPLTAEDLSKARSTQRSRVVEALETQDSTSRLYLLSAVLGSPPEERREFYRRLDSTTDAEIQEAARKAFSPDQVALILVGDRKMIEAQLAELDGKPYHFPKPEIRGREGEE